ncbi:hypothetical protein TCAL_10812 [Tigriopus californicus]|uniref:J domain-containing protein n=1 Tax=Tigriopus californicus TaxID=6832 RepID=A0A553NFG3_TIGCA|nr:hypothetical protein TCAL_10812 [Tigriopus californicus]
MGKTNFQYDETGNTYYYVFLTFLGFVLFPSTYYFWPKTEQEDPEKRRKYVQAQARDTVYYYACMEKAERMTQKDPWVQTRRRITMLVLMAGWVVFAMVIYQISQFDYEMANFDPYEILQVSFDATAKEIKKKYRELSLIYHPDKPTGNEKLFMKLTKAYDALTDETAKYNWEHYGNPDGPQAMQFGIGLPAWIVEEKNSIWVLGVYTLIFMICLPTAVYYWWSNSIKFSGEQVLLDTTQLYYYFFHKSPQMMLKRVLMVLAASLEFERGHNSEIVERPTDNVEIPQLMKYLPNLGINNKEKPLCFGYSVKARALLFAHLSRISLPPNTLHQDRLYIIKRCPFLIHEMVTCVSQLILLAHAGRIGRWPTLDTIENAMKLSPMVVQALWERSSPLLQLPHVEEDMLKYFHSRKRNIKTLQQLAKTKDEDRRSVLRGLTDDQYRDVIRVLASMPIISLDITTEVVDDEAQHVVTAGAIVTVTVLLKRKKMETLMSGSVALDGPEDAEDPEMDEDPEDLVELHKPEDDDAPQDENGKPPTKAKSTPVWKKQDKKKKGGKKGGSKPKQKKPKTNKPSTDGNGEEATGAQEADDGSGSDRESGSNSDSDDPEKNDPPSRQSNADEDDEEDEEAEWEKFQKKINKREKVLEGKSKESHSAHCPYFTDDKQEFWWVYIADRKAHALITPPNHVTSLVNQEEVELKFSAPPKPGTYTFMVCVRSDSYLGYDINEEIKLDVQEAHKAPTEHPQWEFEDDDEEASGKEEDSEDEFATDDEYDEEDEE